MAMKTDDQKSIFDTNPDDNKDYQAKLIEWIKKLSLSKLLFKNKDPKRSAVHLAAIDKLIAGIQETCNTGLGLLDLPNDAAFKNHLDKLQAAADKLPLKKDSQAIADFIDKKKAEKEVKLSREGNLVKEFKVVDDIPGFERTPQVLLCEKIGMDFTPAIKIANEVRGMLLSHGVYDTTTRHKVMKLDIPQFPGTTIVALAKDVSQQLANDQRGDESWRISRIYERAQEVGADMMMLHPDRLEETRALAFDNDQKHLEKIASKSKSSSPSP